MLYVYIQKYIEMSKMYTVKEKTMYFSSKFNGSMEPYYKLMNCINVLIFEEDYEKRNYSKFNQLVTLGPYLTCVQFGYEFNQQLVLSRYITHLTFSRNFNMRFDLSKHIVYLEFGRCFNQSLSLSKNIKCLMCRMDYSQPLVLNKKIEYFRSGDSFNCLIFLTKSLTCVMFGYSFNKPVVLPRNVIYVYFDHAFRQSIILTKKMTYLSMGYHFKTQPIVITSNITTLVIQCNNYEFVDNLPNNLKQLYLDWYFSIPIFNIANSVVKVNIKKVNYEYKYLFGTRICYVGKIERPEPTKYKHPHYKQNLKSK